MGNAHQFTAGSVDFSSMEEHSNDGRDSQTDAATQTAADRDTTSANAANADTLPDILINAEQEKKSIILNFVLINYSIL